jgi:hypothetical protein
LLPKWGLFNGSIGTVKDIVFQKNENPNCGHQPLYTLVEFHQYEGPAWNIDNKKLVPIPSITKRCNKNCCERQYVPLNLAFGRTGHSFQGMNVGPVSIGQPPNMFQKIICDLGLKSFEGLNPGFTYSIFTRCTTIGSPTDKLSSALYFFGKNLCDERISNLSINSKGFQYNKVSLRENWIKYLTKHTHKSNLNLTEKQKLFKWANSSTYTEHQLLQMIKKLTST